MRFTLGALCAAFLACVVPAAASTASLSSANPAAVTVGSPSVRLTILGSGFEDRGHPDMDEYNHWFVRRVEITGSAGEWQHCGSSAPCREDGWTAERQIFVLDPSWFAQPGAIEFRYFRGLADDDATDPSQVVGGVSSGFTNILRVPVVIAPKATPPQKRIVAITRPVNAPVAHAIAVATSTPASTPLPVRLRAMHPAPALANQTESVTATCMSLIYRDTAGTVLLGPHGVPATMQAGQHVTAYVGTIAGSRGAVRKIVLQMPLNPLQPGYVNAQCLP